MAQGARWQADRGWKQGERSSDCKSKKKRTRRVVGEGLSSLFQETSEQEQRLCCIRTITNGIREAKWKSGKPEFHFVSS